ncbi:hypothetical protein EDD22DRAFT_850364 [Suillus occidentalis]|nr:hypothetical protein EDD22DRAFT_850364 [Suillus occidentalis]
MERKYEKKLHELNRKLERGPKTTEKLTDKGVGHEARLKHVKVLVDKAVKLSSKTRARSATPKAMQPVNQVTSKSYIGKALGHSHLDSDPSDDDSSSSSSSNDSTSSESTGSPDSSDDSSSTDGDAKRNKKSRKKKRKSSKQKRHTILKPVPPMVYDGEVDPRAFHRFITEGTAYVKDGRVRSKARVFTLSRYLTGKAHEFYIREVARDPYRWRLPEFFTELFNHCFPVNYRTELRAQLKRCYQNDKTVRAYFFELSELWNMIGDIDERQRVEHLWFGLKADIQRELWKKELNPEVSSFNQVLAAAEVIEISLSVPVGREKKAKKGTTNLESSAVTPEKGRKDKGGRRHEARRGKSKDTKSQDKSRPKATAGNKHQGSTNRRFEPLPKEKHDRLAAKGKCFRCKQPGHQSRHCPEKNNVKGDSPGKPPGVSSYGIHVDLDEVDRLRDLADMTEAGNGLFVGAMSCADMAPQPTKELHLDRMGDPLAERARILLSGTLYPGDDPTNADLLSCDRFFLYRVSSTEYTIMDAGTLDKPVLRDRPMVLVPSRTKEGVRQTRPQTCRIPDRFQSKFLGDGQYVLYDTAVSFGAEVDENLLMNPHFDVSSWYAKRLTQGYNALQDMFDEWACEWDVFRLFDRGPLSPLDAALDRLAK